MKLTHIINEIATDLSIAYPFNFVEKEKRGGIFFANDNDMDRYTFTTEGGNEYEVKFFTPYPRSQYAEGTIEREYGLKGDRNIQATSMTGENKALKVNATVMKITLDWINRNPNFTMLLIRPVDERRQRIVKMFLDTYIPKNYEVVYGSKSTNIYIRNWEAIDALLEKRKKEEESKQEQPADVEEEIKQKEMVGSGVDHDVYPSATNPNVVYKIGREETIDKWYEIFKNNPDIFPKTYRKGKTKITAKTDRQIGIGDRYFELKAGTVIPVSYVELEKLDTKRAQFEWERLGVEIAEITEEAWVFQSYVIHYIIGGDKDMISYINQKIKEEAPQLLPSLERFLVIIDKLKQFTDDPDVHKHNFGYDKQGNLKCLDF